MPAIRYRYNNVCATVLTHLPEVWQSVASNIVEVRTANGDFARLDWRGFICTHALPFMGDGRFCKINCTAVTAGGEVCDTWRNVAPSEYALGWMLQYDGRRPHVFGIVGRDGYPVVVSADGTFSDSAVCDYANAARAIRSLLRGSAA